MAAIRAWSPPMRTGVVLSGRSAGLAPRRGALAAPGGSLTPGCRSPVYISPRLWGATPCERRVEPAAARPGPDVVFSRCCRLRSERLSPACEPRAA
eukprot:13241696-Heterocapsa_arctica.AAC.1